MRIRNFLLPAVAAVAVAAPISAAADTGSGPPETKATGDCLSPSSDDGYGERGDLLVLTDDNRLHRLDGRSGSRVEKSTPITGLAAGERLLGIDVRPANGQLYGVGSSSRLYTVDPASGAAAAIGAQFSTTLAGTRFGVDFNPTVDRLRIVSDTGQNLRIDPTSGNVAGVDSALSYGTGPAPAVTGAAYTNSVRGATSTALYDIDADRDTLVLQGSKPGATPVVSPNTGALFTVGRLDADVTGIDGFDISGAAGTGAFDESDYRAVAAVQKAGSARSMLVTIDLANGKARSRGWLPGRAVGLAVSPGPARMLYATTTAHQLLTFDRRDAGIAAMLPVTGMAAGERLLGIDVRPANGQLYGVGSTNQVYVINPRTAVAAPVGGPFSPAVSGLAGVDFNPVVDRLRIVTTSGQNLRINPDTGAVVSVDGPLSYAPMDVNAPFRANVAHAAYTNSVAGAATTVLNDIDAALDVLAVQAPPNDGTLGSVGRLGVDTDGTGGFDIAADGVGLAALRRAGADTSRLWCVDLATGSVRSAGQIGGGYVVTGLAAAPRG